MTTTTIEPTTRTLDVPGATLAYDVRRNDASTEPILLLIGSPMGAAGFSTLASHFTDRTVVTYDPRGSERSHRTDGIPENTPAEHADDLHRLIEVIADEPVEIFASSGGAVNALELVSRHPDQVRTLVAHEPPAWDGLPDRDAALAAALDLHTTYMRSGFGPAMAKFIALTSVQGPIPEGWTELPAPDPAAFGLPNNDDGKRDDPLFRQNMVAGANWKPPYEALRGASTRIVLGVGEESSQTLTGRATAAIADRLGLAPVTFPSHHGGFLGGESGYPGKPVEFAAKLREVLASA
ncbi:MAG TPA: alpha/beta hydrolase [Candidatus Limnocylindrales bacterium]